MDRPADAACQKRAQRVFRSLIELDAEARKIAIWLFEMRRRAFGVVEKHWGRILALANILDVRGELCREEALAAAQWSPRVPSGPSSPPPAAAN